MGKLSQNVKKSDTNVTSVDLGILRPIQYQYLYKNIIEGISDSIQNNDNRILISRAPTNSGKSFVLVHALIPSLIQEFTQMDTVFFTSHDSGCVDGPYKKFKELWHNKVIRNKVGDKIRLRVLNKDEYNDIEKNQTEFISDEPVVDILFATIQYISSKWKDYRYSDDPLRPRPDLLIVDEIHYAMGTPSAETIRFDQGRTCNKFDPKLLPLLNEFAKKGTKVVGFTGTPTNSQQGHTTHGSFMFYQLPVMSKNKDATAFTVGYMSADHQTTYRDTKQMYVRELAKIKSIMDQIEVNTWDHAKRINITKKMPGLFLKFGRSNATNGVPFTESIGDALKFANDIGADFGVSTNNLNLYNGIKVKKAVEVIDAANHANNAEKPLIVNVIQNGNMGWDIPRVKFIGYLSKPSHEDVTNMQQQIMSRANRMPFDNMHSHEAKAKEIGLLPVSIEQRLLLAQYVAVMSSATILIPQTSDILQAAYDDFSQNTYTHEQGMELYLNIVKACDNEGKITTPGTKTGSYSYGYSANELNQKYKKHYCEACTQAGLIDKVTGKTSCELIARHGGEHELGVKFSDAEWADTWFHTLVVDHINGDHNDYSEENLITRCPTNNGVKTYTHQDYLNRYEN